MKRFLTLLLAVAMVLSFAACGDNGTTIRNENEKDNVKKDPIAAQYLQDLAVKTADYPVLPAMPNESELDEAFSTIDYDKMGADAYEKAQEKIWEDWDARSNAYYDALKALRSKGTSYPAAFLHFTKETGTLLSAEENTVLSPANLYLAFAMLSETTDGDSRAQLLSLLGLENTDASRAAGNYVWRNLYGETSTGKTLLGSSVWLNENVPYNEETPRLLAEQYLASTFSAPMGDEKTDKAIGEWINENTGNLLQDAAGGIQNIRTAQLHVGVVLHGGQLGGVAAAHTVHRLGGTDAGFYLESHLIHEALVLQHHALEQEDGLLRGRGAASHLVQLLLSDLDGVFQRLLFLFGVERPLAEHQRRAVQPADLTQHEAGRCGKALIYLHVSISSGGTLPVSARQTSACKKVLGSRAARAACAGPASPSNSGSKLLRRSKSHFARKASPKVRVV